MIDADLADPKRRLPDLHGRHRWCTHLPPDPRDRQSRFLASHEGQLDYLASCAGVCAAIPATRNVGAILQHCCVHYRDVHQRTHQEEEASGTAQEALRRRKGWPKHYWKDRGVL